MKRNLGLIVMLLSLVGLAALRVDLNEGDSFVKVQQTADNEIELRIRIAAVDIDSDGKIKLPDEFRSHSRGSAIPIWYFHLALPSNGEIETTIEEHRTRLNIPSIMVSKPGTKCVTIGKPYWFRDIRGVDLVISPLQASHSEMEIIDRISVKIKLLKEGADPGEARSSQRINPYFLDIYKHHFLNFSYRYEDLAEYGSMAVICPVTSYDTQVQRFRGLIQPWVDWKNQMGIPSTVYNVTQIGTTYEDIRAFIQDLYDNDPHLTFVQLVGDFAQVPCNVTTIMGNTGGMDAFYSLLHGDDGYPDVFVGRFSAETAAELYTQIKRSLEYANATTSGNWLSRAAGVCSSNPPIPGDDDEHNWEHLDSLRVQLLDFGYSQVERIYGNEGADTQDLVDCLNSGISLLNYCGEGYPDHWVEPEFGILESEALSNTDMLPFIHAVSCWTGQFYDGTCLAEALMRSRDASAEEARGAIAIYTAAPEQGVAPPMEAQDHTVELLVNGTKQTIGGLCYNGAASMIDLYGEGGVYNFLAWNLFGDASLSLRTKPAQTIAAILPVELPPYYANLDIDAGAPDILVSLSKDKLCVVSGFSGPDGMAHLVMQPYPVPGDRYTLTLSGVDRIPVQRVLNCYQYGTHAVLDLELLPGEQFLEPEIEILKTLKITNRGDIASGNLSVRLQPDPLENHIYQYDGVSQIASLQPGESVQIQLSYKVHKGTPDLTTVNYSFRIDQTGVSLPCSDVIHAPTIALEDVYRSPQINWINPGGALDFVYKLRNEGSAGLRDLQAQLSTDDSELIVTQQDERTLNIAPGCSDSLVVSAMVSCACPIYQTLSATLNLEADNAIGEFWHQWKVTDPAHTVESFESGDLQTFPWVYQSEHWDMSNHSLDGTKSLVSEASAADSIWLALGFHSNQTGELSFRYDLYRPAACLDGWTFWIDDNQVNELENSNWWNIKRFSLSEGDHTLQWVGRKDPSMDVFASSFCLDLIEFPEGTLFDNSRLETDVLQVHITLSPGEIRDIPVILRSLDGKDIAYAAVLKRAEVSKRAGTPYLECNKTTFQAGSEELCLFSLYNSDPVMQIKALSITLPERVLALQASSFIMSGQTSLPFTGSLGSYSSLDWSSEIGSLADSLRTAVRLALDASLEDLALPYRIETVDGRTFEDCINLERSDDQDECLVLSSDEGMVGDLETRAIILRANQNLLGPEPASYYLDIYYNGSHLNRVPVGISYDSNPPGFYDEPRLSLYPNPCRHGSTFAYGIPAPGKVQLVIYNLRGQRVRTVVNGNLEKGYYRSFWDAKDDQGQRVGSGVYYCRLSTPAGGQKLIRCVVIR